MLKPTVGNIPCKGRVALEFQSDWFGLVFGPASYSILSIIESLDITKTMEVNHY